MATISWQGISNFQAIQRNTWGIHSKDAALDCTVKGAQFEETKTHIFFNLLSQKLLEESRNGSQKGENRIFEIPEHRGQLPLVRPEMRLSAPSYSEIYLVLDIRELHNVVRTKCS